MIRYWHSLFAYVLRSLLIAAMHTQKKVKFKEDLAINYDIFFVPNCSYFLPSAFTMREGGDKLQTIKI